MDPINTINSNEITFSPEATSYVYRLEDMEGIPNPGRSVVIKSGINDDGPFWIVAVADINGTPNFEARIYDAGYEDPVDLLNPDWDLNLRPVTFEGKSDEERLAALRNIVNEITSEYEGKTGFELQRLIDEGAL